MRQVARTLELSIATPPHLRGDRADQIGAMTNPAERLAAQGIELLATRFPTAAVTALDGIAHMTSGARYLGHGAFASVYRTTPDSVVKVYRHTALMNDHARDQYMAARQHLCEIISEHFGEAVVPHRYAVSKHPLGKYTVVVAHQPYVDGQAFNMVTPNTTKINESLIEAYCETSDGITKLKRFVTGIFLCNEDSRVVPDLNGNDNFRTVDSDLFLIDPEGISASEYPEVHGLIMHQAERLGAFIEA